MILPGLMTLAILQGSLSLTLVLSATFRFSFRSLFSFPCPFLCVQIMALLADALVEIQEQVVAGDNEVINHLQKITWVTINFNL